MTVKMDPLCERLDKCCEMYVETYQSLIEQRSFLNQVLDDGYLNLSKARSIMGCANVSAMQLPSELDARVNVQVSPTEVEEACDPDLDGLSLKFESLNFNMGYVQPEAAKESEDEFDVVDKSELSEEAADEENEEKPKKAPAPVDPTKLPTWFGVLTPLSLKQSHKSFSRSLSLITSISELQTRLTSLGELYQQLLKEKASKSADDSKN